MKKDIKCLALHAEKRESDRLAIEALNKVNEVMGVEFGGKLPVTQILINLSKFYLENVKK